MAGASPNFNAAEFRTAIRATMVMGLPNAEQERATFRWTIERTYTDQIDPEGRPYDFGSTPATVEQLPDVQIPVAVEWTARQSAEMATDLGTFQASRAVLTILDEDYEQVRGADEVLLGENTYEVSFVAPPIGLFDVTVYQVFVQARDES